MALEYHTGFDMLAAADAATALSQMGWTHVATGGAVVGNGTIVRTGTRSLFLNTFASSYAGIANLSNAPTRVLGFGLYNVSQVGASRAVACVGDGPPNTNATAQVGLCIDNTGHLEIRRGQAVANTGGTGTLLATSVNALTAATWQFIELVVTVHASAGAVEVYVNGSKSGWIDISGVNTQNTGNAYSNSVGFGATVTSSTYIDDVYTLTTTGAAPTARLGDCKSVVKFAGTDAALGAGSYADSTPSSGTDRGAMVDENPNPDDDTTYNAFTAAAQKDAYKTAALGLTGTIHAATVRARLKKADAGDGTAQVGLRSGTTDDFGVDVFPSETSYQWFSRQYTANPASALPWTVGALDLAQILVKRTL